MTTPTPGNGLSDSTAGQNAGNTLTTTGRGRPRTAGDTSERGTHNDERVKVDTAPTKNHVADAVKDNLLKELAGLMGETDSEDEEEGCVKILEKC